MQELRSTAGLRFARSRLDADQALEDTFAWNAEAHGGMGEIVRLRAPASADVPRMPVSIRRHH